MRALDQLTKEPEFYGEMHRLAEVAWKRNMTVDALLMLTELLEPYDPEADQVGCLG
ncbi:hypothetical protein ACIBF5_15665 [Micromonospora sp. NPDC050417]|uniref:hypothetical protein n=1 Tax=Micromonospora sp. NPDC050417 TaxID=3364280 RepID=UPI0037A55A75